MLLDSGIQRGFVVDLRCHKESHAHGHTARTLLSRGTASFLKLEDFEKTGTVIAFTGAEFATGMKLDWVTAKSATWATFHKLFVQTTLPAITSLPHNKSLLGGSQVEGYPNASFYFYVKM